MNCCSLRARTATLQQHVAYTQNVFLTPHETLKEANPDWNRDNVAEQSEALDWDRDSMTEQSEEDASFNTGSEEAADPSTEVTTNERGVPGTERAAEPRGPPPHQLRRHQPLTEKERIARKRAGPCSMARTPATSQKPRHTDQSRQGPGQKALNGRTLSPWSTAHEQNTALFSSICAVASFEQRFVGLHC